jgi:hypothetical protein
MDVDVQLKKPSSPARRRIKRSSRDPEIAFQDFGKSVIGHFQRT